MRFAVGLVLGLWLGACSLYDSGPNGCDYHGQHYNLGDKFPAGDGCNDCTCTSNGVACTVVACNIPDANPNSCEPGVGCPSGPACGLACCGTGEKCVNGACMCGAGPACGSGDTCAAGGPSSGGGACGFTCCGASGPCPL